MPNRSKYRSALLPEGALVEYVKVGKFVKVMAVDPHSLEEVALVGDPARGAETLAREAVRKLEYVLSRRAENEAAADPADRVVVRGRRADTPSGWDL